MKIIYIDDEQDEISNFRRSILLRNPDAKIIGHLPLFSLEDTYELIMENDAVDVIVTDHELSDSCDVAFSGAELIEFLLNKHPFLPCFVLTAFEDNAVKSDAIDVYPVYEKSVLDNNNSDDEDSQHGVSFYDRLFQQVEKTNRKVVAFEQEHKNLLEQQNGANWTSKKEERLIYIDTQLERHHGGSSITDFFKRSDYTESISELINVTKELLEEVKGDKTASQD
ncbi:MAG: hypothetical protein OQK35_08060 [Alphaproteobacteria bacterium]|nr:hypothetical protein [Alphaproteobacteria bacterium]